MSADNGVFITQKNCYDHNTLKGGKYHGIPPLVY